MLFSPPLDTSLDAGSIDLLRRLRLTRCHSMHGRVVRGTCCGELDLRIEVCRDDVDVTVEVLCPDPDGPATPLTHAVRIDRGQRAVWRSPEPVHPRDVLEFVDDLLALTPAQLGRRYLLLG